MVAATAGIFVLATHEREPRAADHADSPSVAQADITARSTDILDLYAWLDSGRTDLNLVMTVFRDAAEGARFSDAADYVFHIRNLGGADDAGPVNEDYKVVCTFDAQSVQALVCTLQNPDNTAIQVTGSVEADLNQVAGLRVFAGLRDDPFFFNADGFEGTVDAVKQAAGGLTYDDQGCPDLTDGTAEALVQCLSTDCAAGPGGVNGAAVNRFAGQGVLAIVLQIPVASITGVGSKLEIWASTEVLDQQLDRLGRPAISTALVGTFLANPGNLKDAYNQDGNRPGWVGQFADDIAASLPILDALDSTVDAP
jgi:hypothetical protein